MCRRFIFRKIKEFLIILLLELCFIMKSKLLYDICVHLNHICELVARSIEVNGKQASHLGPTASLTQVIVA